MTQEAETVAMDLNIVSCQTCDALFIESERRQTCPSCGGPPVGPYFQFVLDGSGLHQKDGVAPDLVTREGPEPGEEALEAPLPASPVEEEALVVKHEPASALALLMGLIGVYLTGDGEEEEELRGMLADLGAEPEAAATAVGRLAAVRDLIRELAEAGVEAQVEVTAEETPAEAPEPEPEPESGQKA